MSTAPSTRAASPSSMHTDKDSVTSLVETEQVAPLAARHSKYYFEHDEMAIFLIEGQLFRIHKYFLQRESECFGGMFSLPPGESASTEGRTDNSPIVLPHVTAKEFECLLDFFYYGKLTESDSMHQGHVSQAQQPPLLDTATWIILLDISTRLAFHRLRERAISELEDWCIPDPIERISLAQKYDIPSWLRSAYTDTCCRDRPLEVWEAEKIGLATAIQLAKGREVVLKLQKEQPTAKEAALFTSSPPAWRRSSRGDRHHNQVAAIVDIIFLPAKPSNPSDELPPPKPE
ncbi:hypothetical protein BXZ70DRAFT_906048 [Cristinia sonorae]|uniref:BTB domain-containing protein n=1 Tax=Cristinia sonorae TaxID=1940300 RepID=A0A8K0URZ2_9AGAR|nr:hypothetical protein BXZ70DRAFT_906048 [Cristinia sonorae]